MLTYLLNITVSNNIVSKSFIVIVYVKVMCTFYGSIDIHQCDKYDKFCQFLNITYKNIFHGIHQVEGKIICNSRVF